MAKRPRKPRRSSSTVLIIDHEEALRSVIRRWLEADGYRVLDAADLSAAELLAKLFVGPIHVVLLEVERPGVSGRATADHVHSIRPEAHVVFMSDRPRSDLADIVALRSHAGFIRKPFERGTLARAVRTASGST